MHNGLFISNDTHLLYKYSSTVDTSLPLLSSHQYSIGSIYSTSVILPILPVVDYYTVHYSSIVNGGCGRRRRQTDLRSVTFSASVSSGVVSELLGRQPSTTNILWVTWKASSCHNCRFCVHSHKHTCSFVRTTVSSPSNHQHYCSTSVPLMSVMIGLVIGELTTGTTLIIIIVIM